MTAFDLTAADLAGLTVIEASAGTGKTHAIQQIVRRLVCEGVPVTRMLVMSFTNAAADELGVRIRAELQSAWAGTPAGAGLQRSRLQQALSSLDASQVSTIHGFCQRMLREHPVEAGVHGLEGWALETDGKAVISRCCDDAWAALVSVDDQLASLVPKLQDVAATVRAVDKSDRMRGRVLTANMGSAWDAFDASMRALAECPGMEQVRATGPKMLACFERPSHAIDDLLSRAGPRGVLDVARRIEDTEELAAACAKLCDPDNTSHIRRARVDPAELAAVDALDELVHGAGWDVIKSRMQDVVSARAAVVRTATDLVAGDAWRRVQAWRNSTRTLTFDQMIERLRDATRDPDSAMAQVLRDRFDVVIVDEVQDTDPVQAEILRKVFIGQPRVRVILVGDPKQSIYAFRRADIKAYLALRQLATKPVYRLGCSHRSDAALVKAVERIFSVHDPFLDEGIGMPEVASAHPTPRLAQGEGASAALVIHCPPAGASPPPEDLWQATAWGVAAELRAGVKVLEGGRERALTPRDVAVLCHAHWQGAEIAKELRRLGVPYVETARRSVFDSQAARDVWGLLDAIARPSSRPRALGASVGMCLGMPAVDVGSRPDAWLAGLRQCESDLREHGVDLALRRLLERAPEGYGRAYTLRQLDGERYAIDFDHVVEELQAVESTGVRGPAALARWLERRAGSEPGSEQALSRSMGQRDAVTLMTIHASKGLGFGVVWLPSFMTEGAAARADEEFQARHVETRRMLYVALTRAKYRTHLMWRPDRKAAGSPLAQVLHGRECEPGEDLMQAVDRQLGAPDALARLQAFVAEGGNGEMQCQPWRERAPDPLPSPAGEVLAQAGACPEIPRRAVTLSFTGLSRGAAKPAGPSSEREVSGADFSAAGGERGGAGPVDAAVARSGLRGAPLGILVHEALADVQAFAALAPGADRSPLASALVERGASLRLKSGSTLEALAEPLARALAAPTGCEGFPCVAELARHPGRALRELNVAVPWQAKPSDLARIIRAEGQPWSEAVADAAARMGLQELRGLLVGSIDLAALHDGRWFVYDYKTNDLGGEPAAYDPEALDEPMAASLYPLQAAIYAALLARWTWVRGGRHGELGEGFGGVAYLFVRGMDPDHPGRGTWTWRPSARLLRDLDAVLPQVPAAVGVAP